MSNELKAKEVRVYKGNEITKRESELHPALKNVVGFVSKEDYDILLASRPTEPKGKELLADADRLEEYAIDADGDFFADDLLSIAQDIRAICEEGK